MQGARVVGLSAAAKKHELMMIEFSRLNGITSSLGTMRSLNSPSIRPICWPIMLNMTGKTYGVKIRYLQETASGFQSVTWYTSPRANQSWLVFMRAVKSSPILEHYTSVRFLNNRHEDGCSSILFYIFYLQHYDHYGLCATSYK